LGKGENQLIQVLDGLEVENPKFWIPVFTGMTLL
jgi:hypothetical protein